MNILWIPQISSLSSDGKVLLNKDSNIAVLRNLKESRLCIDNNIVVAFEFSSLNCVIDDELARFDLVFDNTRMFTNAYLERMNFNVDFFKQLKAMYNFDVVFINEPTKVLAIKSIFTDSKIVTYNHWLAFRNMPQLELRQFEGMANADICFVNSDFTISQINDYYKKYGFSKNINLIKAQPTFCGDVCDIKQNKSKAFIYNHRLSSDIYYKKAFKSLCNICDIIESKIGVNDMPIIYFTNPSGKKIDFKRPYFKTIDLPTQKEYCDFLKSNNIIGHINTFFDSYGMWSMSTVDCGITGNVCFLPNKFGYAEIFNEDYVGYCNNEEEMAEKIYKFIISEYDTSNFDNRYLWNHNASVIGALMNDEILKLF